MSQDPQNTWAQAAIRIVAAGLGAAVGGPLGLALGGFTGDVLGKPAAEAFKSYFDTEKFGDEATKKLLEIGVDSLAGKFKESQADLEALFREAFSVSLTQMRPDVDSAFKDWFDHWNTCLNGSATLELEGMQNDQLDPGKLNDLFRLTLERLDGQGLAIEERNPSIILRTRSIPKTLLDEILRRLPGHFERNFRDLILRPKYEYAWKQAEQGFQITVKELLQSIQEQTRHLKHGLDLLTSRTSELRSPVTLVEPFATVPPQPPSFFPRPKLTEQIIEILLSDSTGPAPVAIQGMGGVGKTVLAIDLCYDTRVRKSFPDGILWFSIGKQPGLSLADLIHQMAEALNQRFQVYTPAIYRNLLKGKKVLIVLDDVWERDALQPFLIDSECSRLLYTSRDQELSAAFDSVGIDVDILENPEAREFLLRRSGCHPKPMPEPYASEILAECKGLVLGLAMIGGALRGQPTSEWPRVCLDLKKARLKEVGVSPGGYAYQTLYASIAASVNALDADARERYLELAVLLEDMSAPAALLHGLWGGEEHSVFRRMRLFVARSLAHREADDSIRLHDFQLDFVRGEHPAPKALGLQHSALLCSLHVLRLHPDQFSSQMIGRLLAHKANPSIAQFLKHLDAGSIHPRLCPLWPALEQAESQTLRVLEGQGGWDGLIAISADGLRVVFGSIDNVVCVWDWQSSVPPRVLRGHAGRVCAVAISANGRRVVSGSDDSRVRVWDLESSQPPRVLEGHDGYIRTVAISANGRSVVSGSNDRTLRVWDLEKSEAPRVLNGHTSCVSSVAVSANGNRVVSVSGDLFDASEDELRFWDLTGDGRSRILVAGGTERFRSVAISANGERALSLSNIVPRVFDMRIRVWDLMANDPPRVIEGYTDGLRAIAIAGDGECAVTGSIHHRVEVWDIDGCNPPQVFKGHVDKVSGVAISADGNLAGSISTDGTVRIWNLKPKWRSSLEEFQSSVTEIAISASGEQVISSSLDGKIRVWDIDGNRPARILEGHTLQKGEWFTALAISHKGECAVSVSYADWIFVQGRSNAFLWNLKSNGPPLYLDIHDIRIRAVAISANGPRVVFGSDSRKVHVWFLDGSKPPRVFEDHTGSILAVAISADGKRVVSGSDDRTSRVWNLETGEPPRILEGHRDKVNAVALSPDGKCAVSGSDDRTVRVWNLEDSGPPRILEGHTGGVLAIAVSADSKRIVSGSEDHTIRVWDRGEARCQSSFICDAAVSFCAWVGERILACDRNGKVHLFLWEE